MQTRRAQKVDARLGDAIRQACLRSHAISGCYLLDARRRDTMRTALLVALVVDDEAQFETAAQAISEALADFSSDPEVWIISAPSLDNIEMYRGTEFYVRAT